MNKSSVNLISSNSKLYPCLPLPSLTLVLALELHADRAYSMSFGTRPGCKGHQIFMEIHVTFTYSMRFDTWLTIFLSYLIHTLRFQSPLNSFIIQWYRTFYGCSGPGSCHYDDETSNMRFLWWWDIQCGLIMVAYMQRHISNAMNSIVVRIRFGSEFDGSKCRISEILTW